MKARGITLKQISDTCGLSLSTVSAALNNSDTRYNAETVNYVRSVAKKLHYRTNLQARILRGARSGILGIIKSISLHQITADFAIHAGLAIGESGYRFFSSDVFAGSDGFSRSIEMMLDARVEGILVENQILDSGETEALKNLLEAGMPVVLIDGNPVESIPHVTTDYYQGFLDLFARLAERGCKNLALAATERDFAAESWGASWRTQEARRALEMISTQYAVDHELLAMPQNREATNLKELYFSPSEKLIHDLADRDAKPRAIVFVNDLFAAGALRACADAGIRVPEDLAIAACDGSALGQYTIPRLSSIKVPTAGIARKAVQLLTEQIQHQSARTKTPKILLPPEIRFQESCGTLSPIESQEPLSPAFSP